MSIIHTSGQWSVVGEQWSVAGEQWSVVSGQWPVVGEQQAVLSTQYSVLSTSLLNRGGRQRSLSPLPSPLSSASCSLTTGHRPRATVRRGFTMMELLVVVVIIGILAGMVLGALQMARQAAREAKTKTTITKLNNIIMQRYESYMTRRAPVNTTGMQPTVAARARLDALRDIMRMEMPDAKSDITNGPITFSWGKVPEPPLHKIYAANPPTATLDGAQCLYLIVSLGNPEAMEQFNPSEIGMIFDSATNTSKPCFIDGWGKPIMWLRWAPGFNSPYSALQVADATKNHDPFDPRGVDGFAYHLIPLIYSCGGRTKSDGTPQYGIDLQAGYVFAGNPYANLNLGAPISGEGAEGNITNHYIEQR